MEPGTIEELWESAEELQQMLREGGENQFVDRALSRITSELAEELLLEVDRTL